MTSASISQKPAHGTLKRLNISTYQYTAKARTEDIAGERAEMRTSDLIAASKFALSRAS